MRCRVLAAASAAMFALLVLPATAAVTRPSAQSPSNLRGLSACLAKNHHLNVDVMMDESGSLSESVNGTSPTDPNNERVGALQALLADLSQLPGDQHGLSVSVALQGFSGDAQTVEPFGALTPASLPAISTKAAAFTTRDTGLDTDFYSAVSSAQTGLANQAATDNGASCQVLLLFTDGVYSYAVRPGVHKSFAPGESADTAAAASALAAAGQRALCGVGGPVDQVRADGDFFIAIGLGPGAGPGAQLLSGMALGGSCGTRASPGGAFLPASNVSLLDQTFAQVGGRLSGGSDNGLQVGLPRAFELGADLSRVTLTSQAPSDPRGVSITLSGPTGGKATFSSAGAQTVDGIRWSRTVGQGGLTTLIGTPANDSAAWSGGWTVTTSEAGGAAASTDVIIYGDLSPTVAAPSSLTIGAPATFTINLRRVNGAGPTPAESRQLHAATLSVGGTGSSQLSTLKLTRTASGAGFTGTYPVPGSLTATSATATIDITSLGRDGAVLTDTTRSDVLPVFAPATLPQPPTSIDFGRVVKGSTASAVTTFTGGTAAGCVSIGPLSADDVPSGVKDPAISGPTGCLPISARATITTTVRLTHSGKGSGRLSGSLAVSVKDASGHSLVRQIPVSAAFSDPVSAARRWAIFFGLLGGGILIPLLLIYALALALSKFRPRGTLRWATVPATVKGADVSFGQSIEDAAGISKLLKPLPETSTHPWVITLPDSTVLRSHVPLNPFRTQPATATGGGLATIASEGTAQRGGRWAGQLSTQLGASWVYVVRSVARDGGDVPEVSGDLTILTAESRRMPRPVAAAMNSILTTLPDLVRATLATLSPTPSEDRADVEAVDGAGSALETTNSDFDFDPFSADTTE